LRALRWILLLWILDISSHEEMQGNHMLFIAGPTLNIISINHNKKSNIKPQTSPSSTRMNKLFFIFASPIADAANIPKTINSIVKKLMPALPNYSSFHLTRSQTATRERRPVGAPERERT
jgi:hypothetical protein